MRIVIAGGSGLIGQALSRHWLRAGHQITVLTRQVAARLPAGVRPLLWDAVTAEGIGHVVDGADAIVNLCGESVGRGRWTAARKRMLVEGRTRPTTALAAAVTAASRPPTVFVQASGVGYYGTGNEPVTEASPPGGDFLARLALAWEASAAPIAARCRLVVARFGVVLDATEGAFARLLAPIRFGIGGPIAGGRQWMSWIHIDDAIAAVDHLIARTHLTGPVNCTAPGAVTNADATRVLGALLRRPTAFGVPRLVLATALGEMATLVCDGHRALPQKLVATGFAFRHPDFSSAAGDLIARRRRPRS
jgi:uncharacterized protein (TIGR01777 family)